MKAFIAAHRKVLGLIAAVIALGVAALYLVIVPEQSENTTGFVKLVLLYGHSLCWLLLAGAFATWALNGPRRIYATLAYSALAVYGIFMLTFVTTNL